MDSNRFLPEEIAPSGPYKNIIGTDLEKYVRTGTSYGAITGSGKLLTICESYSSGIPIFRVIYDSVSTENSTRFASFVFAKLGNNLIPTAHTSESNDRRNELGCYTQEKGENLLTGYWKQETMPYQLMAGLVAIIVAFVAIKLVVGRLLK